MQPFSRLVARDRQEGVRFWPSFDSTRLDPIGALADRIRANRAVEGFHQRLLGRGFSKKERRAKGIDSLEGSREAEGARHATLVSGCGGYHTPHQIIG